MDTTSGRLGENSNTVVCLFPCQLCCNQNRIMLFQRHSARTHVDLIFFINRTERCQYNIIRRETVLKEDL